MGVTEGHRGVWAYVEGGMGALSASIAASARHYGAEIRTNSPVASIDVDGSGNAIGVVLEDGTKIRSKVVLSNATPHHTFQQLCPKVCITSRYKKRYCDLHSGNSSIGLFASHWSFGRYFCCDQNQCCIGQTSQFQSLSKLSR
jgi:phytoene dehydrogenase-like protein